MTDASWDWLDRGRAVLLTTYRRSGEPVSTPVGYGTDGEWLYFMTDPASGKVKRLRREPRVAVAPCTLSGRVTGPSVTARARPIAGAAAEEARRLITGRNRLAWFFLLRKARRDGRSWVVYAVTRGEEAA